MVSTNPVYKSNSKFTVDFYCLYYAKNHRNGVQWSSCYGIRHGTTLQLVSSSSGGVKLVKLKSYDRDDTFVAKQATLSVLEYVLLIERNDIDKVNELI